MLVTIAAWAGLVFGILELLLTVPAIALKAQKASSPMEAVWSGCGTLLINGGWATSTVIMAGYILGWW